MFKHFLLKASSQQSPERIDSFITSRIKNYTRSHVKKLCGEQRVLVNDIPVKASYMVKPDDEITTLLPYSAETKTASPDVPLDILFEDEGIIVINKAAGFAMHPGLGDHNNDMLAALVHYLGTEAYVAHRIDKHTSGAVVFAKNHTSLLALQKQFIAHKVERVYHCVTWNNIRQKEGKIEAYIGRNPLNERLIQVSEDKAFGKNAVTRYKVLEAFNNATLAECVLETGRTHQIRIHMQYTGHALIGDKRYPQKEISMENSMQKTILDIMPNQALHAKILGFFNPSDGQYLRFDVPYPDKFQQLLRYLRKPLDL